MAHRKIHYQIYQKPRHKYMYPHFSSNHPHHVFTGIIKPETTRYSRLSATIDDYRFTGQLFSYRLSNLDYPDKLIRVNSYPWLPFRIHKQRKTQRKLSQNSNSPLIVYYCSKYNKHLRTDKIVQSILRKYHNLHIPKFIKAYYNTTKLHSTLLTNKILHSKLIRSSVDIFNLYTFIRIYYVISNLHYNIEHEQNKSRDNHCNCIINFLFHRIKIIRFTDC